MLDLKTSKTFLNRKLQENISYCVQEILAVKNVLLYHKIAHFFNLPIILQTCSDYTDRCFTLVAETPGFLELDFFSVKKILQSSKLCITSEIEVFYAANDWVGHNSEQRSKFAKDLLLSVRLPLLSKPALTYLLQGTSSICNVNDCKLLMRDILLEQNREILQSKKLEARYCDQDFFKTLVLSSSSLKQSVTELKEVNLKTLKAIEFKTPNEFDLKNVKIHKVVFLKTSIYMFVSKNFITSVIKFSSSLKNWETLFTLKYREHQFCEFGVTCLINNIYVIGGEDDNGNFNNSCFRFDTKNNKKKEIIGMLESRIDAACAIFEGRIVVSGGFETEMTSTKSVEVYDHISDAWSLMPSLVNYHVRYSLIAIKSKLFVIGQSGKRSPYEVYDKTTNVFSAIKSYTPFNSPFRYISATSIGNKIAIFGVKESKIAFYCTDTDRWYEKSCDDLKLNNYTSCIKIPQM